MLDFQRCAQLAIHLNRNDHLFNHSTPHRIRARLGRVRCLASNFSQQCSARKGAIGARIFTRPARSRRSRSTVLNQSIQCFHAFGDCRIEFEGPDIGGYLLPELVNQDRLRADSFPP